MLGIVALVWWLNRTPKPKYNPNAVVFRESITPCDGCGCLLYRWGGYRQPSTIDEPSHLNDFTETIHRRYLCLRCQVDGKPPAKGGTIPPPPNETARPC
jgi:hypothetical protein